MIDCAGEPVAIVGLALASLAVIGFAVYTIKSITNRLAFKNFEKWRDRAPDRHQTNMVQFFPGMTADQMGSAIKTTPCPVSIFLALGQEFLLSQSKRRFENVKIANGATVRGPLKLCGLTIGQLEVENIGELHLEKCKIGTLMASGAHPDYRITDCM